MTDTQILTEIARNEREISHEKWGIFVIKRPTQRIQSMIDSARTRSVNTDLQTRVTVPNPDAPDKVQHVPAYLTKAKKRKLLEEFGEWSEANDVELRKAEAAYRDACVALDDAGFESVSALLETYKETLETLKAALGPEKAEKLQAHLNVLVPIAAQESIEEAAPVDTAEYMGARKAVERSARNMEVSELLVNVDRLHKQYTLLIKGIQAQTELFLLKLREITMFSDTIEARAEKAAQIVKIVQCTVNQSTGRPQWDTTAACEASSPDFLAWVLTEIEKFERLDPETPGGKDPARFNFLSPLDVITESSDA